MTTSERLSGTVTFLFTDIEGSTRLLKQLGRARYGELMADQQRLLREAFTAHRGEEIDTQGDSFFVAFRSASDALMAAVAVQLALAGHRWPDGVEVRVRVGIHTGEAAATSERYLGLSVHRAARIGAAAHGGQVLLSSSTRELVEDDLPEGIFLRDLGAHRLKDIERSERISQLAAEGLRLEFPPLRGAERVKSRPILRRRSLLAAMAAGVVAAAVAIPVFALGGGSGGPVALAGVDANAVGAVDASTGRLVSSIPVGTSPGSVAFGEGAIWVTNADGHSVSRIDPKTNAVVQTIQVGTGPAGVAVGGDFVWVANSLDGTVSKIDPNENNGTVVDTFLVGNRPNGIAFGAGSVWVVNSSDRTLMGIDPRAAAGGRPIPVGAGADAVAVGGGFVWVTSESANSVARINVRTGTVLPSINVGNGPSAVAVGPDGTAWVANALDGTVSRIDPKAGTVVKVIPVGDTPTGIAIAGNTVWVSNERAGTLSRIDPARNRVVKTVRTGNRPEGVALAENAIYVAVRASGLAHRGGMLTVLESGLLDSIDPAQSFAWGLLILTNDGLTGYKRVGGSDGARLVPDLAISLPAPTDGGRTYTFQLRPGIHYSNGSLVRPADFRRGLERLLASRSYLASYFAGIVGARACTKKRCDLSQGIVADPASNTVTLHLTAPDPDLLHKLTLPAAFAVPAGTPLNARLPLPATGPYMIASYNAKRGARLVRNPRFHEWSAAAQPSGYPNEIVFRTGLSPKAQVRGVEGGRADLGQGVTVGYLVPGAPGPSSRLSELRRQYASRLQVNPANGTGYLFLNTRLPPFDNVKARQAVSHAVDRNRAVELEGGPDELQPTCQVLPPNFDSYRRYCPYTRDGSPTGAPNLVKARELVAASGTSGQAVTVWTRAFPRFGAYFVSVLRSLGYRARLKVVRGDLNAYFASIGDSRRKIQAGTGGWGADYLSASTFLSPLFTCASYHPRSTENLNLAEFCHPRIDAEIARARSLQTSDPQAASQLWSKIDRDIDQAPWIPLWNGRSIDFVSRRVGNYQYNPQWGALIDQMWVK